MKTIYKKQKERLFKTAQEATQVLKGKSIYRYDKAFMELVYFFENELRQAKDIPFVNVIQVIKDIARDHILNLPFRSGSFDIVKNYSEMRTRLFQAESKVVDLLEKLYTLAEEVVRCKPYFEEHADVGPVEFASEIIFNTDLRRIPLKQREMGSLHD